MDDGGVLALEEGVDLIDILPATGSKAQVVQADAVLDKAVLGIGVVAAADPKRGPTADIVDHVLAAEGLLEAQKGQQCLVKAPAAIPVTHRQDDVGHSVDFDHAPSRPGFDTTPGPELVAWEAWVVSQFANA